MSEELKKEEEERLPGQGPNTDDKRFLKISGALALASAPWVTLGLAGLIFSTNFYAPLLSQNAGQIIFATAIAMTLISIAVMLKFKNPIAWIAAVIFLILPQFAMTFLGPSIITIINAIGPG